ncbi:MAG: hypothetical protein RMK99_09920 [Anaerolineales bacterium]|nr:hypothetical protein [Anaerolineales bacterium]
MLLVTSETPLVASPRLGLYAWANGIIIPTVWVSACERGARG